jgi:hypothetical protein
MGAARRQIRRYHHTAATNSAVAAVATTTTAFTTTAATTTTATATAAATTAAAAVVAAATAAAAAAAAVAAAATVPARLPHETAPRKKSRQRLCAATIRMHVRTGCEIRASPAQQVGAKHADSDRHLLIVSIIQLYQSLQL